MRVGEKEGKDRGGGEGKRRTWSLGRRLELGTDGMSRWTRSGGRDRGERTGRRGGCRWRKYYSK